MDDALRESPRMLLARLELDVADGALTQARAGLYPTLNGFSRGLLTSDIRRDRPGTVNATKIYYDIGLSQPLFHWGEKRNNARIGAIRASLAERDYEEGYRLLAREIRQGYLRLISLKSQLVGARFGREQAAAALRAAEERVKAGLITGAELFGPRIALERAELSEASAEAAFIAASEQFELLTGAAAPTEVELPEELPEIQAQAEATGLLFAEFLAEPKPSTPTLERLEEETEIARLTYKNQKTRLRPKFNFTLGVSQDEQSYTINSGQRYGVTSRYAGIQVNWAIFDGWANRGAVRSSLARLRSAEARYTQAQSAARQQARAATRALELAQREMQLNDRLLSSSRDYLQIREDDFAAGRISREVLDQAQSGYYSARTSANNARLNYLMAQVELLTKLDRDPLLEHLPKP
ncbi:hypothetical protein AXK12_08390 [Cephaloticoccus capnophilus]|uniref:Transporter n=1 Tax=Cephaloticoccus capnophilus TaxID=1548208 RepID=A0A139SHI8_9BACT|nr:hypothetical protein AXK12_08390 [Cephaloticoccus capnophilus]